MLPIKLTSAVLATALTLVPTTRASADTRDFLAGAVLGGVAGALIQKEVRKQKLAREQQQRLRSRAAAPQTYASAPRRALCEAFQKGGISHPFRSAPRAGRSVRAWPHSVVDR